MLVGVASLIAVFVFWAGSRLFKYYTHIDQAWSSLRAFHNLASAKFWIDEIYHFLIVKPVYFTSKFFARILDRDVIDRTVDATGTFISWLGIRVRKLHTGDLQDYGSMMAMSLGALMVFLLLWAFIF